MTLRKLVVAVAFVVAGGCGGADGPQPLIAAHGSVEFADDVEPDGLQPAVVFLAPEKHALHIVDADGDGELPKRFEVALWEPPPKDAFAKFIDPDAKSPTSVAIGFIAAVSADHPEYAPRITQHSSIKQRFVEGCEGEACTCGEDGCLRSESFCIGGSEGEDCYRYELRCPYPDAPDDACTEIESEGDRDIARQPWVSVRGLSQNYLLLYLKQAAVPNGRLANGFGAKEGLAEGYHLIEMRSPTAAEEKTAKACQGRAERLAAERYNEKYGTSKSVDELKDYGCPLASPIPGLCADGTTNPFPDLLQTALFELKCSVSDQVITPVSEWADISLSVRMAQEIRSPLTFR